MTRLDLAVVGGGVAGSFVAYRMSRIRPDWSIGLFEGSGRIGGRLLSVTPPGINGIKAELGGMRFRTSQPNVSALVDELELATRPFRTIHDDNEYLLRGVRLTAREFRDPARVPYAIDQPFRGKTPGELLFDAIDTVIPGAGQLSAAEWAACKRTAVYKGRRLYEWALGDVLRDVAGDEGYALITDSFGYVSVFGERNAADGLPWLLIEARPESENTTLVDGMERLPRELAARFGHAGGSVLLNRRLVAVHRGRDRFELDFQGGERITAQRVVLAMPRGALERIDGVDLTAAPLRAVTSHPAGKLCLAYESAWWREWGVKGLRTTADSPLQKIYWFDRGVATAGEGPVLALSYTDGRAADVWRSLAARSTVPADAVSFE